jgi:hypothetical protein
MQFPFESIENPALHVHWPLESLEAFDLQVKQLVLRPLAQVKQVFEQLRQLPEIS